jgi:hypothetical protein
VVVFMFVGALFLARVGLFGPLAVMLLLAALAPYSAGSPTTRTGTAAPGADGSGRGIPTATAHRRRPPEQRGLLLLQPMEGRFGVLEELRGGIGHDREVLAEIARVPSRHENLARGDVGT